MSTSYSSRSVILLFCCVLLLAACGSGSPTATIPEGPRERTFTGRFSVGSADSLGGIFHLTTVVADRFAAAGAVAHPALMQTAFNWFAAPLWAQAAPGTASGSLVTNGGETVQLAGSYSNGSFNVSGGGYTIDAGVTASGSLSGTGTAPGGAAAAVSPLFSGPTSPPPSNPTGTYAGSFEMLTTLRSRNVNPAGGLIGTCIHPVKITGDLVMHVTHVGPANEVTGHLDMRWKERPNGGSTCPPVFSHSADEYFGIDFDGVSGGLHPVRTYLGAAGPGNAGTLTRTQGFSGMVSGSTVVGTVFLTMNFRTPVPEGIHTETFSPAPSISVTLTRR